MENKERTIADHTIVVVGMAGRFAGCDGLETFWRVIARGESRLSETRRWQHPEGGKYVGGFIDGHACFDAAFFKISPNEARCMDPQQRLLMQTVQHAIDDSFLTVEDLRAAQCGVFAAGLPGDYKFVLAKHPPVAFSAHSFIGNAASSLSGRISYFYDFNGPSLTCDTACSSSLAALHEACLNITHGHCGAAIVGAVSVFSTPELFTFAQRANMASEEGKCAAFGEEADGFVPAEGCASVILMRYKDAKARGLRIHGAIAALGVNHNGRSNGLMAPNAKSQAKLIGEVYRRAEISPRSLAYVETHGTGTRLGDPLEISALTEAFAAAGAYDCHLGALKPLIGHTLVCSGLAGIIKVLLSFKHQTIPPFPAVSQPNALIDFGGFRMNAGPLPWPEDKPFCAVSAFGFTGANGHVIVQKIPCGPLPSQPRRLGEPLPFCLSARQRNSVIKSVRQHRQSVENIAEDKLYDLSQMMMRRPRYELHCVITAAGKEDLLTRLDRLEREWEVGSEITDDLSEIAENIRSLARLWQSGESTALRRDLDGVDRLCPDIVLPGYPFDARHYWVDEIRDAITSPDVQGQTPRQDIAALLSELTAALAELTGLPPEALRGDVLINDVGLDSLSAIRLLAPYQNGDAGIKPHEIFKYPTLADLAAAVARLRGAPPHSPPIRSYPPVLPSGGPGAGSEDHQPSLRWLSYGEGENVVILASPLNTGAEVWSLQINVLLQSGRRVLIPLYPGHNGSPFKPEQFSLADLAKQFIDFIHYELPCARVDLVGWSLGGCISLLVATAYPESVRSLTLISTAASFSADVFGNTLDLHKELKSHQDLLEVIFDGSQNIVASLGAGTPLDVLRYYYDALRSFNAESGLRDIAAPVLLIHGQNDCVIDEPSFDRLSVIPRVLSHKIAGQGHFIPLTASRWFNNELLGFLSATRQ